MLRRAGLYDRLIGHYPTCVLCGVRDTQLDWALSNVSVLRVLGVNCFCRDSGHARGEACVCVCAVSERVRGVDLSAGRDLSSTSLSGTLPESIAEMTGLSDM